MKSFKLDPNGDFVFENGSFLMIVGDEELAQQVVLAVKTSKGEWFLDPEEGADRSAIFSKVFDEQAVKDSLIESIEGTSESLIVEEIFFVKEGRNLQVYLNLKKEDGSSLQLEGVEL